ncbi:MAG TPA: hypothetical protein VFL57_08415 [Bryobacteraceae bacterium]|nr:hypothetical protein [Bryobacteraceae bacterium]
MEDSTTREFVLDGFAPPLTVRRKDWEPAYRWLGEKEIAQRAAALQAVCQACRLCPRQCGVDRTAGGKGVCGAGLAARVASWHPHFGEERPLVGSGGSGTIFFSRCNLLCVYCQNWEISHLGMGQDVTDDELAAVMLGLQLRGCHNINCVTPSHVVPNILGALRIAMLRELRIPLVYNCSGYESVDVLRLLDGIVDIYLADCKYTDPAVAAKYSRGAADYPEICAAAITEMHRQVGHLQVDEQGIAVRGLIIRHLVLPDNLAGTDQFVQWVARSLGRDTYVNIMAQYRPAHQARRYPEINRSITSAAYARAIGWARAAGLTNLDRD